MMLPLVTVRRALRVVLHLHRHERVYLLTRGAYNIPTCRDTLAYHDGVLGGRRGGAPPWPSSWVRCW